MSSIPTHVAPPGAFTSGSGALSVAVPVSYQDGDVLVLLVESAGQDVVTPSGWVEVASSLQSTGVAGEMGSVRLEVFYKVVSGAQTAVAIADTGKHTTAQMFCFRGVDTSNPVNATSGSVQSSAATNISCPSVTTTTPNCLVLHCVGLDNGANSTANLSAWTNSNLSNLVEIGDATAFVGMWNNSDITLMWSATSTTLMWN